MSKKADVFSYTPQYLTRNGEPWFPIMGEIHYSRYPEQFWKDSILKMKAGGVNIVSAYTIWIHHEEIENEWDFEGQKNLRKFVETIQECGLYMILRVGPWSHAEVRNGGFPDWLINKGFPVRGNDERYLAEVRKFYAKIYEQVKGLLLKDGGPIIGLQIENEFGHCGGLTGEEGEKHMHTLQDMAKEIGFDVPIYTATGWGGAITAGMLPVMGGYVDAPWDQRPEEIEPSGNYVITYERNDHNIGSDFGFCTGITFDITKYPYLTAELGGGLEPTFLRRPVPTKSDIGAESLVKLGSGVSLLGYYMYHGGTNPYGKLSTLQESKATGSLNDLPELSYDFFAPVREYGQISPVYGELKLNALFTADFGSSLCMMDTDIPSDSPVDPADTKNVRYSFRMKDGKNGKEGYLFVNNYVRHQKQDSHKAKVFAVPGTDISFPALDIDDGDYYFLPFNFAVGDAVIRTALATPLCRINEDYVFYKTAACKGHDTIFEYVDGKKPSDANVILLTREQAEKAYKIVRGGKDYLVISPASVTDDGVNLIFQGTDVSEFYSFPELPSVPHGYSVSKCDDGLFCYKTAFDAVPVPEIKVEPAEKSEAGKAFCNVSVASWEKKAVAANITVDEILMDLYYNGSYGRLYDESKLIADNLFCGKQIAWQIALGHLPSDGKGLEARKMLLEIQQLKSDEKVYIEDMPVFKNGIACDFVKAEAKAVYKMTFKF